MLEETGTSWGEKIQTWDWMSEREGADCQEEQKMIDVSREGQRCGRGKDEKHARGQEEKKKNQKEQQNIVRTSESKEKKATPQVKAEV